MKLNKKQIVITVVLAIVILVRRALIRKTMVIIVKILNKIIIEYN